MGKREVDYQRGLIKRIERRLPGCVVVKNNPDEIQGIPDLLVLFNNNWAMLEVKLDADSDVQPNQEYYVNKFNEMSFSAFIYPDVEEKVLDALQSTFGYRR